MPGDGGVFFKCFLILRMGRVKPGTRRSAQLSNQTTRQQRSGRDQEGALGRSQLLLSRDHLTRAHCPSVPCPMSPMASPPRPPPQGWPLAPIAPGWSLAVGCVHRAWRGTGLTLSPRGTSQPGPWHSPSLSWCLCTSDKNLLQAMGLQHPPAPGVLCMWTHL